MSVTELIKQVAAPPPPERTLFDQLFHAMEKGTRAPALPNQPPWPDFGRRLRGIYGAKVVPDSRTLIEEGLGDR